LQGDNSAAKLGGREKKSAREDDANNLVGEGGGLMKKGKGSRLGEPSQGQIS
jgi:hypothetical protein